MQKVGAKGIAAILVVGAMMPAGTSNHLPGSLAVCALSLQHALIRAAGKCNCSIQLLNSLHNMSDKSLGSKLKATSSETSRYVLKAGYVTKMGQVVKNWKTRYLILYSDGMMYYYKRETAANSDDKPQGEVNITKDCIGILTAKQVTDKELIKWPEDAGPKTGFAIETRGGRTYFLHCESWREADRWIASLAGVAPNVRYEDGGAAVRAITQSRSSVRKPNENKAQVDLTPDMPETELDEDGNEVCYVHKVVGGMVIKEKHVRQ
eukprot:TRINITY_DN5477_c0_g1_i2.p1 TRINITY_DN5477_c0_g1~~TRINITY_DN5477_c0_g1_i2.p1  ORF type:complete len:264 (+),score=63.60 TRINITY_DN5477_c0_g1_i2:70-861(+)